MSMESIAARAGVSKVSLYRRWSSKLALVTEVLRMLGKATPVEDHGSLAADIRALLKQSIGSDSARSGAKIAMRLAGEIGIDPELRALYRTHLFAPRMQQLRGLVERARSREELREGLPTDVVCAMIGGPLFLHYLTVLAEVDVDAPGDLVEQLTRAILRGVSR